MKDFEIRCDESRLETTNLIYGKFTLGPFLPGQATTFGNALRRSLLAELSGLAITAFEIVGVMQEFSTLPGLRESILDLSLNLKQIVLTGVLPHSTPPIGFLNVRGPAIIKAIDLKLPAGVYCASPNQYIATLGSNGMLHIKFIVSIGKGYSIQPYSIYRSLSKIRLQPASNFDNTVVASNSLLAERGRSTEVKVAELNPSGLAKSKQLLTPFTTMESVASNSLTQLGVKDLLAERGRGEMNAASDSAASLASPSTKMNPSGSGLLYQGSQKQRSSAIPITYQRSSEASASVIKDERMVSTKSTAELLTTAQEGYQRSATDSIGVTSNEPNLLLREPKKSKPASKAESEAENLDSSQSTFFTNEQNSSYINIQTQLFQRITPHQVLPIDAVFTPVSQVNFLTEVNDRFETARENIVLEIWTNGSIHPKRALEEATLSLVQNFDTLLKKIQQASSFYKGLRYWTYLQPFKSSLESSTESVAKQGERPSQFSLTKPSLLTVLPRRAALHSKASSLPLLASQPAVTNPFRTELSFASKVQQGKPDGLAKQRGTIRNELLEKLFKKDLPQSIYNLDIGNLNLSLQTFIFLKKVKIHTLLQLLTQFSPATGSLLTNTSNITSEAPNPFNASTKLAVKGLRSREASESEAEGYSEALLAQRGRGEMNVRTEGFYSKSKSINYVNNNKESKSNLVNEKIVEELNNVIRQFGSEE